MDETESVEPEDASSKAPLHHEGIGERHDDAVPSGEDLRGRTERRLEAERKLDQHLAEATESVKHPGAG
jgi:hypothetical protein